MRRIQMVAMIVILGAAPVSASAQCAWILWEQTVIFDIEGERAPQRAWQPVMGSPTAPLCTTMLTARLDSFQGKKDHVTEGPSVSLKVTDRVTMERTYTCLPDTIDPRGPRGGSR